MMNKRGMTLEAVFWLILAVIGIILLVYAFDKVLGFGCTTIEKEQAKAQSIQLMNFLNDLSSGSSGAFVLDSPINWYLISYQKNDARIPTGFFMQNLVCICNKKDCTDIFFCEEIQKPIFENTKNLNILIDIKDLRVTSRELFYEANSAKLGLYKPSNTKLDELFRTLLNGKYIEFVGLGQCMEDASKSSGVPVGLIIAVAAHESDYGKSDLSKAKCSNGPSLFSNNLFGITKGSRAGQVCNWPTRECLDDAAIEQYRAKGNLIEGEACDYNCGDKKCVYVRREFLAYLDRCESIKGFVDIISKSEYYKKALQNAENPLTMIDFMIHTGVYKCGNTGKEECSYATDPNWAIKVSSIASEIKQSELA